MVRNAIGILLVSGCVVIGAPASAHHSMVAYEDNVITTLGGVIHKLHWRSPHILVELAVPTADGQTEIWTVEGTGVAQSAKSGITPTLLAVGTKVKIYGRRHRDHTRPLALLSAVEVDGRVYGRSAAQ